MSGAAFPLNGLITPGVPGYNPDLPALKFDPERAKKLLAEAGYPDGKGMPPIDIPCTEPFKDEITYYANQLDKVLGMHVNVKVVERAHLHPVDECRRGRLLPLGLDRRLSRRRDLPARRCGTSRARSTGRAGRTPITTS